MKIAVVFFNLGGPSNLTEVEKFLFNLFNDPAIIKAPKLIRYFIALLISKRRRNYSTEIYRAIGGKSPILEITKNQADLVQHSLQKLDNENIYKTFVVMRYSNPRALDVAREVLDFAADKILLIPLYPQFSTTTTGSSLEEFKVELEKLGSIRPEIALCCYFNSADFINLHQELVKEKLIGLDQEKTLIIFSAHSLPKKTIDAGDPYQFQTEESVRLIMEDEELKKFKHVLGYQSKVGPVKWLSPETLTLIRENISLYENLVLVPISFVSDHSETLYELDILYKNQATAEGLKNFLRVDAFNLNIKFIEFLAKTCLTLTTRNDVNIVTSLENKKLCPKEFCNCGNQNG